MEDVPEVPYKQDAPTTDIHGQNCASSLGFTAKISSSNSNSQSDCSNFPQRFGLTANSAQTSAALVGAHVDPTVVHFVLDSGCTQHIFNGSRANFTNFDSKTSESAQPTTRADYQQEVLATYLSCLRAKMTMKNYLLLSETCCGHQQQSVPYFLCLRQSKEGAHTASMLKEHTCSFQSLESSMCGPMNGKVCTLFQQNSNWHHQQLFPCLHALPASRRTLPARMKSCVWRCRYTLHLATSIGQV